MPARGAAGGKAAAAAEEPGDEWYELTAEDYAAMKAGEAKRKVTTEESAVVPQTSRVS